MYGNVLTCILIWVNSEYYSCNSWVIQKDILTFNLFILTKMQSTVSKEEKIKAIYEEMANKEWDIYCGIIEKYRLDWTEDRKIYI